MTGENLKFLKFFQLVKNDKQVFISLSNIHLPVFLDSLLFWTLLLIW